MSFTTTMTPLRIVASVARRQFGQYKYTLAWLLRDLIGTFPRQVITVTGFSMLGAMLRGLALGAGVRFLQMLENSDAFSLFGRTIEARNSEVMTGGTLIVFLLLSISAWILFRGRINMADLLDRYQAYQSERIVTQVPSALPDQRPPPTANKAAERVARTVSRDAQQCASMVRYLGRSIPALVTLGYSVPVIVYLDPIMTLSLAVLVLAALPLFYRANIMAYESTVIGRTSQIGATRALAERLSELQHLSMGSGAGPGTDSGLGAADALRQRAGGLPMYLRSIARTEFGVNLMMSIALGLILYVQVPHAIAGQQAWATVIAYLVFLRLTIDGFGDVLGFLNIFSKLYPAARRYQKFTLGTAGDTGRARILEMRPHPGAMVEHAARAEIEQPRVVALICRLAPTRYSLPYIVRYEPDAASGILLRPEDCFLVGRDGFSRQAGSLREMLALSETIGAEDIIANASDALLESLRQNFGAEIDLDRQCRPEACQSLAADARIELGLISAILAPAQVVVIASDTLLSVPQAIRERAIDLLRECKKYLLIVYSGRSRRESHAGPQFGESLCAVVGTHGDLLAVGSPTWYSEHLNEVRQLLLDEKLRLRKHARAAEFETDDELE